MLIDIYETCFEDERYSKNGINLTIHRAMGVNEVIFKFECDAGETLFKTGIEFTKLKEMIKRIDDN